MMVARDVCLAKNLPHTVDDNWGGDIIAAACTHIAATVEPRLLEGVWIAQPYITEHYDENSPVVVDRGEIKVPTGIGLGVIPDEKKLGAPILSFS